MHFSEISLSRNHSENMLKAMKAPIRVSNDDLSLEINPLKTFKSSKYNHS